MSLPKGTSSELSAGESIAADTRKLTDAGAYWKAQLATLGETAMDTGAFSSEAMKLAAALPDSALSSLVSEFSGFFSSADESRMVSRSGCLVSAADVAQRIFGATAAPLPGELKFLADQAAAGKPQAADRERLAKALRLVREVYDMVRRLALCTTNGKATGVPRSELLAIYFQEGALGIAPPRSSWLHGPLIRTTAAGCPTDGFLLWDVPPTGTTSREAFLVSHVVAAGLTPSKKNPTSMSFGTGIRHLTIMCGLDSLVMPRLLASDELVNWYAAVRAAAPGTHPDLDVLKTGVFNNLESKPGTAGTVLSRQNSIATQRDMFDGVALGLLMARLEVLPNPAGIPDEKGLISGLRADMDAFIAAHPTEVEPSGRIFLAPGDDFADAAVCSSLQARWYASRRRVDTVLAMRDRGGWKGRKEFAPILAYLRYNIGEFNFLRALARFATKVAELKKPTARKIYGLADPFVTEIAKVAWSTVEAKQADDRYQGIRKIASTSKMAGSPGWRHVGFHDAIKAKGPVTGAVPAPAAVMIRAADLAREILQLYEDKGFFDLLALFVLSHSIDLTIGTFNFIGLAPADSRPPVRNAFSFERLRRGYAKAMADAGLPEQIP